MPKTIIRLAKYGFYTEYQLALKRKFVFFVSSGGGGEDAVRGEFWGAG